MQGMILDITPALSVKIDLEGAADYQPRDLAGAPSLC